MCPITAVDDKPVKFTEDEIRVLSYIEQKYWETKSLVTNEKIKEVYPNIPMTTIRKCWEKPEFLSALATRGVDVNLDVSEQILTPEQLMLANLLLNSHDKRSVREKLATLEKLGFKITSVQYQNWLAQPAFQNYLRSRAEQVFRGEDYKAYQKLADLVDEGKLDAIKFFMEVRGIYNPKLDINVNIDVVMVKMVEIISKYVKDPVILQAIASELEAIDVAS